MPPRVSRSRPVRVPGLRRPRHPLPLPLLSRAALFLVAGAALAAAGCTPVGMAVGAGATAGIAAFQERPVGQALDDAEIKLGLNDRLMRAEGLYPRVSTTVMEGRVMLTGVVEDDADRAEAERIAWTVPGVREVINEIEVAEASPLATLAGDEWIAAKLRARLLSDFEVADINYAIDVVNGSVYVLGIGQNTAEIERVAAHARDTAGVRRVAMHAVTVDDPRRVAARPAGVPAPVPFEERRAGARQGQVTAENQPRPDLLTGRPPRRAAGDDIADAGDDIAAYENTPAIETASVPPARPAGPRSLAPAGNGLPSAR